ncbi:MAG: methyltransferase domain-containing protein [Methylococcaceae bacterium]|nr:methyltransferase domain-containing protein [Methylococcaceae bacterium]
MSTTTPVTESTNIRLNLGCGRNSIPGWVNIDIFPLPGVDFVADLEDCQNTPLPFQDDSVDEFLLSHVLEHMRHPLELMQELHRIAKPGALMVIRVPHGASDDAFEDPTHVRQFFTGSFGYFSQPYYWRADYGYRGDWLTEKVTLVVSAAEYRGYSVAALMQKINHERNIVIEIKAELRAVKPVRQPLRQLQQAPQVIIDWQ